MTRGVTVPSQSRRRSNGELAERVKLILASKGLTLYQVSERSATLFGRSSPHYLPHNLYYDLRQGSFSPSLFQVFAFSRISNYRVTDWLKVFGFDVEAIPRLQIQFSSKRTGLLDSSMGDPNALVPWLRNLSSSAPHPGVVPLSQVLEWKEPRRVASLSALGAGGFLYARIGYQDALAFPELLPGTIARVRPEATGDLLRLIGSGGSQKIFLVEHGKGLCCCHVRAAGAGRIATISTQVQYAQVEFKIPEEARIIGIVDLEIRSVLGLRQPVVPRDLARRWKPEGLLPEPSELGTLLRRARLRMGLSLRAASAISREIANLLGDERYFVAPGSLSDYETLKIPPRHFHKIVTFCAVYSLHLHKIFETLRLSLRDSGHEPIPHLLTGRPLPATVETPSEAAEIEPAGFIRELLGELGEAPFFLRESLKELTGLARPSLKDFFWIGRAGSAFHPYLTGAVLAVVNRQKKKPNDCGSKPLWEQPLYVILQRDGTYVCGCCSRENNSLVVHSYPGGVHTREQFRNHDAEVIGKIVTIVRRLI
jgi:transcriptional regulator with XRE-family HTH domain